MDNYENNGNDTVESVNESTIPVDHVKNLKSEMDRKLQNINDQLKQQNDFLSSQLNKLVETQSVKSNLEEPSDFYDLNPREFKKDIVNSILSEVDNKNKEIQTKQVALQQKVIELQKFYPEISNPNSELYQTVLQEHNKLPAHLMETPEGYEMATLRAANKVGVMKNSSEIDEFNVQGRGNKMSKDNKGKRESGKISEKTKAFAQLLGRDLNDPATKKRLLEAIERDTFNRYR